MNLEKKREINYHVEEKFAGSMNRYADQAASFLGMVESHAELAGERKSPEGQPMVNRKRKKERVMGLYPTKCV